MNYRHRWALPHSSAVVMCLILLLAFGLRVYHLDFQSFWIDEGISLTRATVPFSEVVEVTPVEHMPTYFAALHLWTGLSGSSDFALRFFSLWASLLAIALTYRLAVDLGAGRSGLIAALLLATGSFQVWYAQEARMYTWLLATSLLATCLLWRLLVPWPVATGGSQGIGPRVNWGALFPRSREFWLTFGGYVIAATATIYLHYYGFLLLLAHSVFVVVWLALTRDLRAFTRWVAAGLLTVLVYLPALPRLLDMQGYSGWRQHDIGLGQLPWYFLTAYTAGDTMPEPWHSWVPWLYVLLALAGLVIWWRANRLGALLLLCSVAVPLAAAWVIAFFEPQFHERYTILVTGPLLLLAANGFSLFSPGLWTARSYHKSEASLAHEVTSHGRARATAAGLAPYATLLGAALLAGAVSANALALNRHYFDEAWQKPDYRAATSLIQQQERPGDIIISDDPMLKDVFMHYYRGNLPVHDLRYLMFAPEEQAPGDVQAATSGARRAWFVEEWGAVDSIKTWLDKNGWPATELDYNGLHLKLYGLQALPQTEIPVQVPFGQDLLLSGASLAGGEVGSNGTTFRAGDLLGVTTRWEVLRPIKPLMFSLRLVDSAGRRWLVKDYLPQVSSSPNASWQPGGLELDRQGFLLPPDLPPGPYEIQLVLYDPPTGAVMPAGDEPSALLARINVLPVVTPPSPSALPIPVRLQAPIGEELEILGYEVEPDPLRPESGGVLHVWWRARRQPTQPYQVQIRLVGRGGQEIARSLQPLSIAPPNTWSEGQIVGERYPLSLDPGAVSGVYQLSLSLAAPNRNVTGPSLIAGPVRVQSRSRTYHLPLLGRPLEMKLGEDILLRKYALDGPKQAGGELGLTLYWQASERVSGQYKVFVHLLDDSGRIVAQADSFPAGGEALTESWLPGEVIADTHTLTVPGPGKYRLLTGLYDPTSGQRLPVWDGTGQPVQDDAILVQEIQVSP